MRTKRVFDVLRIIFFVGFISVRVFLAALRINALLMNNLAWPEAAPRGTFSCQHENLYDGSQTLKRNEYYEWYIQPMNVDFWCCILWTVVRLCHKFYSNDVTKPISFWSGSRVRYTYRGDIFLVQLKKLRSISRFFKHMISQWISFLFFIHFFSLK